MIRLVRTAHLNRFGRKRSATVPKHANGAISEAWYEGSTNTTNTAWIQQDDSTSHSTRARSRGIYRALEMYGPAAHSRTVALFALIGVQLGHMFNCRSRTRSAFDGLFRNPFIWIAALIVISLQLLAVYLSPLALVLDTVRPSETDWLIVSLCALAPIVIVEMTKAVPRWKGHTRAWRRLEIKGGA